MLIKTAKEQEYSNLKESTDSYTIAVLTIAEDWTSRLECLINEACGGRLYSSSFNKFYTPYTVNRMYIFQHLATQEYIKVRKNYNGKIDSDMYIAIVEFISEFWAFGYEFEEWTIDTYWKLCEFCERNHSWNGWPYLNDSVWSITVMHCSMYNRYKVQSHKLARAALDMGLDTSEVKRIIRHFNQKVECY